MKMYMLFENNKKSNPIIFDIIPNICFLCLKYIDNQSICININWLFYSFEIGIEWKGKA
jgi:hypothetical protein